MQKVVAGTRQNYKARHMQHVGAQRADKKAKTLAVERVPILSRQPKIIAPHECVGTLQSQVARALATTMWGNGTTTPFTDTFLSKP